jgi:tetratricopeptide (TPR) repeat protein
VLFLRGEWDEALARAGEIPGLEELEATEEFGVLSAAVVELLLAIPQIYLARGQVTEAAEVVRQFEGFRDSADMQARTSYAAASCAVLRHQGRLEEALSSGLQAFEGRETLGGSSFYTKLGFVEAAEAAFELDDLERVETLLEIADAFGAGDRTPFLDALSSRFAARLAVARDDAESAERAFRAAAALTREIELPFWLAVTELEHAEWLVEQGRPQEAKPLLVEARETFGRLGATPWIDRAAQASPAGREPEAVTGRS